MIYFDKEKQMFYIETPNTSYVIKLIENGHLLHLYWGEKIPREDISHIHINYNRAFSGNLPDASSCDFSPDTMPCEYSTFGYGDYHYPSFKMKDINGNRVCDFRYKYHKIIDEKPAINNLPSTKVGNSTTQTLILTLTDEYLNLDVNLYYSVFDDTDIIARHTEIVNHSANIITLYNSASLSTVLPDNDFEMIDLYGAHSRERNIERLPLRHGLNTVESRRGASSHQANPFVALVRKNTTEDNGEVFAFSLVYSGNFAISAEVDQFNIVNINVGISPFDFEWELKCNERFETPEALMVYTNKGLNDMSQNFHQIYFNHLSSSKHLKQHRPIVLNSWEAAYFDYDNTKIKNIINECKTLGVDTFVLDDGWFGHRDDDTSSLGDWFVDTRKFPNGLDEIIDECSKNNLNFGLWFEPEMISSNSKLYETHPDWALQVKGRSQVTSRHQLVLDLSRKDVCDYIKECLTNILSKHNISYVKWDMNRHITDLGSLMLPSSQQMEVSHRYMLGLYNILEYITNKFPNILFEGCSGGGGRFDFGMLYYMPQTWTSDNTDAVERLKIQYGTSYVYPPASMVGHVSICPNHQTKRNFPLKTRGDIAMSCAFGYELDPSELSIEEKSEIKLQCEQYKKIEDLILEGKFYRIVNPFNNNSCCWQFVSLDKAKSYVVYAQVLSEVSIPQRQIKLKGLDTKKKYFIEELSLTLSGAVLMNVGINVFEVSETFKTSTYTLTEIDC